LKEFLERQHGRRARVAVFGDAMLDEYYDVAADRVSPEFPIPVMLSPNGYPHKVALGGAANVCAQLGNFNFDASLFALTNERIKDIRGPIDMGGCIFARNVPVKKRFYCKGFPLCRMDIEQEDYNLETVGELSEKIFFNMLSASPFDVVVFSDYGKGMFSRMEDGFIGRLGDGPITIVDPKAGPASLWRGCSIIKPNAREAALMSGETDWQKQCEYFFRETDCQAVVITQAGDGVVGNVMGSWFEYRPKTPTRPRSVIGAGDAFVAFMAMCMSHAIDIRVAVEIAFKACSIYVGKDRNSPVYPYELEPDKFVIPRSLSSRDFRLSFANGCFDILHPGHIEMLEFAKSRSDRLVVALNSDRSVAAQGKSHPMVNDLEYRKRMVAALGCVDFVVSFDEDTPHEIIKQIRPDVLVKGSDWPNPIGSDIVEEVCSFGLVGGHSTTDIIRKISGIQPK
jgi:D-beta-D-heptose 7-phosphate kinase/D-beta-D-heptose 1-phosphate adenosyltransferase